jgi:hypothetical protein
MTPKVGRHISPFDEKATFAQKSGIMSRSTTNGMDAETLLDDAAPGSHIGLFACPPPRKYLKTWKILWSHPALTGKQ